MPLPPWGFFAALQFLTRIPVRLRSAPDLARSVSWFPVIGVCVGAVVGGVAAGLSHLLPPAVAAAIAVMFGVALTGARAVIAAGRRLSMPWRALAWLGACVPGPLREPVYRVLARNRIKWFGRADLCAMPDPELQRRLI
jgi:hypothetical protein